MKARWLHRLVETLRTSTTGGKEKHRRDQAPLRPQLEQLEDRLTPATFVVNSPLDFVAVNLATGQDALGRISLRSAIQAANAQPSDDTIQLPGDVFTLTRAGAGENAAATGDLDITNAGKLTITGAGASATIIDAASLDRVFDVSVGANLELSGVTVRGGNSGGGFGVDGAGIRNIGTLTVTNSTISRNSTPNIGGGIFNTGFGTLTVTDSTLSDNTASAGGGIFNSGFATLTVIGSTLSSNSASSGGGLSNNGKMTVTNSTLSGNSAGEEGGGISNELNGLATVSGSTLFGNSATTSGGGISNDGALSVSTSTLSGNSATFGGGISNSGGATVSGSTLFGNSAAASGGGLSNNGTLTVTNSTLSGNSASPGFGGGGIHNAGTLTVTGSTLAGNSAGQGGGLFNGDTLTINNTILAGNSAALGPDVRGSVTSSGNNLISDIAGSSGFGPVDLVNVDPRLGPLANHGGPTLTHALLAGSPALDAGNIKFAPHLDQRGFPRVVDGPDANTTAKVDIGAFEAQIWLVDIANQFTNEDTPLAVSFPTSLGIANVTVISSDPAVVLDADLRVTGAGAGRTLTITPVLNQGGILSPFGLQAATALITVTVSDGTASMTDTFVVTVNPVNDAPVLNNNSFGAVGDSGMRLQAINEDDVSSVGTRVSDLILSTPGIRRITDVDAGAVEGLAVTAVDNSNGVWQFSTDAAATFTNFGAVSDTSARLLAPGAFIRFVPNANFNGISSFTFRAWDQVDGVNGDTEDTSTNGGSTAFSLALATASITVLPVDDAPQNTVLATQTILPLNAAPINTVPAAQRTRVNKPLAFSAARRLSIAAGTGIVRVTLTVTRGTLRLGTTAGLTSVRGNGKTQITLTGTVAAINNALGSLRYKPTTAFRGKAMLTIFTEDLGGPLSDRDDVAIAVV